MNRYQLLENTSLIKPIKDILQIHVIINMDS